MTGTYRFGVVRTGRRFTTFGMPEDVSGYRLSLFRYGFTGMAGEAHPLRRVQAMIRQRANRQAIAEYMAAWRDGSSASDEDKELALDGLIATDFCCGGCDRE